MTEPMTPAEIALMVADMRNMANKIPALWPDKAADMLEALQSQLAGQPDPVGYVLAIEQAAALGTDFLATALADEANPEALTGYARGMYFSARQYQKDIRALTPPADRLAVVLAMPEVRALVEAASGMKAIVEEIKGAMEHGTWRDDKGTRLKDTPEWVALYVALAAMEQKGQLHD